ncbi:MAG: glyoxylate/hydroxypyruvate reductase A [Rhodobacteraceae bacterium]|nr:glyoxylate/hydroxypyruvate reductase A [Paracoccaceae bacterium]
MKVLFAAGDWRWPEWEAPLRRAFVEAGLDIDLTRTAEPAEVEAMIYAPGGDTPADFTPYGNCRAVLSLWAGVERIVGNPTLTQPLCRMVDPGLTAGMVEYVVGHTLRYHLGLDRLLRARAWHPVCPPLASQRPVAMLGLGALGAACGQALACLGFPVLGWSRTARDVPMIECHHGREGLRAVLEQAQVVVTLLPATPGTENTLDAETLGWLPRGAVIINPGRGTLIDDDALLAALETGQIAGATLDVFRQEPLPEGHPYWAHPAVTVTPHIAADTRPASAARVVAENLRRLRDGEPLLYRVNRDEGY